MQRIESVNADQPGNTASPENNDKKVFNNVIDKAGSAAFTGAAIGAGAMVAMVPVFVLGALKAKDNGVPIPFFESELLNNMANFTLDALFTIGGTVLLLGIAPPAMLYSYIFPNTEEYDSPSVVTLAATTGAVLGLAGYGAYRFFKSGSGTANDESSCEHAGEQSRNQQMNN